jgi:ribonuclease HI
MVGQELMVLVHDCEARLQALQAVVPNIRLVGFAPIIERSQLVDLAVAAAESMVTRDDRKAACRQKSLRTVMDDPDGREVIIATDGSVGREPGAVWFAGWGWISDEGFADAGPLRGVREPTVAELKAVAQACAAVPAGRPLVVLTDSRVAVEMVRRLAAGVAPELVATLVPRRYLTITLKLLAGVQRRLDAGPLTVQWVKGHAGHPLQETADRLAVLGRRRYQAGLDDAAALTRAIADEFCASTAKALSVLVA